MGTHFSRVSTVRSCTMMDIVNRVIYVAVVYCHFGSFSNFRHFLLLCCRSRGVFMFFRVGGSVHSSVIYRVGIGVEQGVVSLPTGVPLKHIKPT